VKRPAPSSTQWLRAALVALVASVLALAAAGARTDGAWAGSRALGAAIFARAPQRTVEATPPRAEPQLRRDGASLQDLLQPLTASVQAPRRSVLLCAPHGLGPGYQLPRDRTVAQFRRRIPRLSSEEPPWS
jgi:hypothetical protein